MSALLTQCPGITVQTGTGKVDPARKFKCTTAVREITKTREKVTKFFHVFEINIVLNMSLYKKIPFSFLFSKLGITLNLLNILKDN